MAREHDEGAAAAAMVRGFTGLVEAKLREAASLAKTANALDAEGLSDRAFETLLDAEPLIHDANALLNAASIIRRYRRGDPPFT